MLYIKLHFRFSSVFLFLIGLTEFFTSEVEEDVLSVLEFSFPLNIKLLLRGSSFKSS